MREHLSFESRLAAAKFFEMAFKALNEGFWSNGTVALNGIMVAKDSSGRELKNVSVECDSISL